MTPEDVAKRYEFARQGLTLVGYEEVGLPFYRIRLRAFTLEHKPIPPIQEFVLRSMNIGVVDPTGLREFLGLPDKVVQASLSALVCSEDAHMGAGPDGRSHVWGLTTKGRKTLETAELVTPQQGTFEVDFDGLLRRVVNYKKDIYHAPRELKEEGLLEIPAHPVRAPEMVDLVFEDVAREIANEVGRLKRQLVSVVAIEKRFRVLSARGGTGVSRRAERQGGGGVRYQRASRTRSRDGIC